MINKLMGGISRLLYERFGEDTVIYQDEVPQGFPEPYFFLLLTEASTRSLPNRRGEETDSLEHCLFSREAGQTLGFVCHGGRFDALVPMRHADGRKQNQGAKFSL